VGWVWDGVVRPRWAAVDDMSSLLLSRCGYCSDEVGVLLHFLSFFLCLDFLVEARLVRKRPFDEIRILAFGRGSQALYGCLDGGRKAACGYDT